MTPSFAVEKKQRQRRTVRTRVGTISAATPSHLPLRPEIQYCMLSEPTKNTPSPRTLRHLKTLQHKVDEEVSVAKTRWSCHLAEEIHNMNFNPKEAWASIGRLTGGESSHQTSPKVIQMRLPSGNLADNDEENVSVFANHFKKVLNNKKNDRHNSDKRDKITGGHGRT